jgi:cytoskeleton protein RodZ
MAISRETGILILEQQSEQQELKDIIASREDGFGFLFKQARNEKKLGIEDVARELRLDKKIILALESEDHTQLPVSAFVCGYIRNYAKFLNIQPEPLIEYYKKERNEDSLEPQLKIRKKIRNQSNSLLSALMMPLFSLLIFAALMMGGWQLWSYLSTAYLANESQQQESILSDAGNDDLNHDESDTLLLPEIDASYDLPAGEEVIEKDSSIKEEQTGTDISLPIDNVSQEENVLHTESALPSEVALPAEGSTPAEGFTPAEGSLPAPAEAAAASAVLNASVNRAPIEMPAVSASADDSVSSSFKANQLVMKFTGNSWVSIKDADNKILSSGLIKSGKILHMDGKLPYKVFLGDARMVTISINGHVFDHSSYINDKNVARFKVK